MTKQEVISILNSKGSDQSKFGRLILALQQAPVKNLASVSFYNRSGFSAQRFKTLVYDVKKSYGITDGDLSAKPKAAPKAPEPKKDSKEIDLEVDFEALDYHKELRPLAADVAEATGDEPASQKKADLIAFLEQAKKEPSPTEKKSQSKEE